MPSISQRGIDMPNSPIRKLAPLSDSAKARGLKVYHLNIGQPDLPTPEEALEAIRNIDRTILEYSPSDGYRSYREKLIGYYAKYNINVSPDDIIITTGGSEAVLSFLRERFPMDTTIKMDTHYGDSFSFDTHLRSDDMDFMIGRVIDRFSGEAALSNIFDGVDDIANTRIKIQSELDHAVSNQHITPAQRKRELDTFDDGIAKLRGTHNTKDVNGVFDAFGRMFQNLSYSQNGANMGFNQVGEVGGAIAYSSTRMLYHMVPILKDVIHNIQLIWKQEF